MSNEISFRKGYKYQLAEPCEIDLPNSLASLKEKIRRAKEASDAKTVSEVEDQIQKQDHLPLLSRDDSTSLLRLSREGKLLVLDGYAWDGPSGPAIDTTNFMRGSLVHDVLYQLIRLGQLDSSWRDHADKILRELCIEDGMSTVRAWWVYTSVKSFAQRAARPSSEPQIFKAP